MRHRKVEKKLGRNTSHRRALLRNLMTRESVSRLFDTVAPRFGDRNGGYLRIIHKGWRAGDGAATVYIELLGSEKIIEAKRAKRAEVRTKRQEEVRKQMEEEQ